jgi:hypothetical protein
MGDGVEEGTVAVFCVESSHANLELAVDVDVCVFAEVGVRLGVGVVSGEAGPVNEGPRLKRLAITVGSSSSSSESYSSSESDSGAATPRLTGAEDPLNQFCRAFAPALIFGCDAVDSIALLEGIKLARDLVGEWRDAREVCCWMVDVALERKGWQLFRKVPVNDLWWPCPMRGEKFSSGEGNSWGS